MSLLAQVPVDDSRHSVLRRSRRARQQSLAVGPDRGEGSVARGNRRYHVEEVDVRSALTRCRIRGEPWSLNPYTGCSHDCVYCYVPDVANVERPRWGSYVVVKRNLPTVLARELKRRERRGVFLSSATDPYQPVEGSARVTRRCLELLVAARWPVSVLTRNPLVVRDLDLFPRFEEFSIGMSVPTLDEAARRVVEPGAPPVEARLKTIRRLADAGLEPYVNLAPCYPLSGDMRPGDVAEALHEAGAAAVFFAPWRYMTGVRPALAARVLGTEYDVFARAVEDPGYVDRLFRSLRAAFRHLGLPFSAMY